MNSTSNKSEYVKCEIYLGIVNTKSNLYRCTTNYSWIVKDEYYFVEKIDGELIELSHKGQGKITMGVNDFYQRTYPISMYIVSNAMCDEGEYGINTSMVDAIPFMLDKHSIEYMSKGKHTISKVIATNNLVWKLPEVPDSFLKLFCQYDGKITSVIVEFEELVDPLSLPYKVSQWNQFVPVVDENYQIKINLVPKLLYPDDVLHEIRQAYIHGQGNGHMLELGLERDEIEDYMSSAKRRLGL